MNMTNSFQVPANIIFGGGASQQLGAQLAGLGVGRVLIVTDTFMVESGVVERVLSSLAPVGIEAMIFSGVQPDPTTENVLAGLALYREFGADGLVAIGGGSPIDAAKAISILTANPTPLSNYQGYHKIPKPGAPLIAIPTTAGTGSEATKVAVITDTERDVKMMMLDHHLLPTVALVDYELTLTMPAALTAHVGVDTLTHGIEAYVSRKASAMTDPLALSCIGLVARHLVTAWAEPGNHGARAGMMLAACQGGMAFANASVALVHGMSRPIGAIFHVPHGLSNAVLLPTVTRYSLPGSEARYATIARTMGLSDASANDSDASHALVAGLESLNVALAVPRLRDCRGVDRSRFDLMKTKMAEDALTSGSPGNNPVIPSLQDIIQLYEEAW